MTRYLFEILIAAAALVVTISAGSWWAAGAAAAGVLLGFGLFRYMLANRIRTAAFKAVTNHTKGTQWR